MSAGQVSFTRNSRNYSYVWWQLARDKKRLYEYEVEAGSRRLILAHARVIICRSPWAQNGTGNCFAFFGCVSCFVTSTKGRIQRGARIGRVLYGTKSTYSYLGVNIVATRARHGRFSVPAWTTGYVAGHLWRHCPDDHSEFCPSWMVHGGGDTNPLAGAAKSGLPCIR